MDVDICKAGKEINKLLYFDDKIIAKTVTEIGYYHNGLRCCLKYGP